MHRARIDGDMIIYHPGAPCRELLELLRQIGLAGDGLEIDCVSHASVVIGVEISYGGFYGRSFRRAMAKPYPGGFLSINLGSIRRKIAEVLREKALYDELRRGRGLFWQPRKG